MPCLHCDHPIVNRPRGLCWVCYYTPGVKEKYGPLSKYGRRGVGHRDGALSTPTTALPGTPEKLAVLEQRAANGESLWHPEDPVISGTRAVSTPWYSGSFRVRNTGNEMLEEEPWMESWLVNVSLRGDIG